MNVPYCSERTAITATSTTMPGRASFDPSTAALVACISPIICCLIAPNACGLPLSVR